MSADSHRFADMTTPDCSGLPPAQLRRVDGSPVRVLVVDDEPTLTEPLGMA